jgi:gliding motility-associated-like protein
MNRVLSFIFSLTFVILSFSAIGQELCNNGIDDDGDGLIDCNDSDCQYAANIEKGCNCADGIDNDGDGNSDNRDSECAGFYGLTFVGDSDSCDGFDSGTGGSLAFAFLGPPLLTSQNTFDTQSKVAIGDVNCDGIPDVIATSKFNQEIRIIATTNGQATGDDIGDVIQDYKLTGPGAAIFPFGDKFFFELEILIADIDGSCPVEIYTIASSRTGNGNSEPNQYYLLGWRVNPSPSTSNLIPLFDAVPLGTDRPGSLGIADFDCDGEAEIFIKDQIFDAETGELLLDGNIGTWDTSVNSAPVAADIIPGGNLEMVVGNILYQIPNLPDGSTQTPTILQDMNAIDPTIQWFPKTIFDASEYGITNYSSTSIADVNNDGNLDIVMSGALNSNAGATAVFFWDIFNGTVDVFLPPDPTYALGWPWGTSRVNLGDIDGDGKLELTFIAGNQLYALEESGGVLTQKWVRTINDSKSGVVSTTVYDFDNDGNPEVVYRDAQELVVVDGLTGATVLWSTPCQSHTNTEGPIIADVNGDGSTDMCVTCATAKFDINDPIQQQALGQMRCFFSEENNWLPTRPVWNQQGYAATNIADDLSVPCPSFDMTATFMGDCDGDGTPEENRPLNTFMNQVPTFGTDGCPYFPAPDISFIGTDPTLLPGDPGYVDPSDPNYFPAVDFTSPTCGDLGIVVGFNIINSGSLTITADLDISFWEGDPSLATDPQTGAPAVLLHTSVLTMSGLQVGDTLSQGGITFDYSGTSSTIYIVLNDDGSEFPIDLTSNAFSECFIDNNIFAFPITPEPFVVEIEKISDNANCNAGVSGVETGELRAVVKMNGVEVADLSPYSFQWYDGADTLAAVLPSGQGGNTDRATALGNGDYTVVVTNTNKGCSSLPVSETIIQTAQTPNASIQVNSQQTQCTPPNGELEVVVVGDLTGVTFDWRDEFGTPLGITGPIASDLDEGGYAVIVTRNGCPLQLDANITGPLVPDVSASVTQNITSCADLNSGSVTSEVFLSGILQDPNLYTFNWYYYDIATSTVGSTLPPGNGSGPSRTGLAVGDYAAFATQNSTGCVSTLPAIVSVGDIRQYPVAAISQVAPQTSCDPANPNGILEVIITKPDATIGNPSDFIIEWFRGDNTLAANLYGNTSADDSQALNIEGGGIPYTVKVTDANGCADTDKFTIVEDVNYPIVTITKISDNYICDPTLAGTGYDGEIALTMTFDGVNIPLPDPLYEITWYSGGNTGSPVIAVADNTIPNLGGLIGGQQYTAVIERTDLFCTSVPVTVNVANILPAPVFTYAMNPSTYCSLPGNGSVIVNNVEGAAFNSTTHTINWYDGNAIKFVAGVRTPDDTNSLTYVGSGLSSGDEVLLEVIINSTGCSSTQIITITDAIVLAVIGAPVITADDVCNPALTNPMITNSGEIDASASVTYGGAAITLSDYQFNWYSGSTTVTLITSVQGGGGTNGEQLGNLAAGFYTITVERTTPGAGFGCTSDPLTVEVPDITVLPTPTITLDIAQTSCDPLNPNGQITASALTGGAPSANGYLYEWFVGNTPTTAFADPADGTLSGADGETIGSLAASDYTVLVTDNTSGCQSTLTYSLVDAKILAVIGAPVITADDVCNPALTSPLITNSGAIDATASVTYGGAAITLSDYQFNWYSGSTTVTLITSVQGGGGTNGEQLGNLAAGFYTITVERTTPGAGFGCTSDPLTVEVPDITVLPTPTITLDIAQTSCDPLNPNGQITASALTGGAPSANGYLYEWFVGNTPTTAFADPADGTLSGADGETIGSLAASDYTVLVTDNTSGCQSTLTYSLVDAKILAVIGAPVITADDVCNPALTSPLITNSGAIDATASVTYGGAAITLSDYQFNWYSGSTTVTLITSVQGGGGTNGEQLGNLAAGFYTITVERTTPGAGFGCTSDPLTVEVPDITVLPTPTITLDIAQTSCDPLNPNGQITASALTGGAPSANGYLYEWFVGNTPTTAFADPADGTLSGADGETIGSLAASDYTVLVTDNTSGCQSTLTYSLVDAKILAVIGAPVITADDVCNPALTSPLITNSGAIDATASVTYGGAAITLSDYQFNWYSGSTTVTLITSVQGGGGTNGEQLGNLAAGFYTITVERTTPGAGFGCTSDPLTVEVPDITVLPTPTITLDIAQTSCDPLNPNGQITASALTGGAPSANGYLYEWFVGNTPTTAFADPADGTLSGADGETIGSLAASDYTVLVTDNTSGCQSTLTYSLVDAKILAVIGAPVITADDVCNPALTSPLITNSGAIDATASVTYGGAAITLSDYQFNWYSGSTTVTLITSVQGGGGTNGEQLGNLAAGFYTITVERTTPGAGFGCTSDPLTVEVPDITVLPTPTITLDIAQTSCDVANPNGQITASALTGGVPSANGYLYEWFVGNTPTTLFADPADGTLSGADGETIGSLAVSDYTVLVTDNTSGCQSTLTYSLVDAKILAVIGAPVITADNICNPALTNPGVLNSGEIDATLAVTYNAGAITLSDYRFDWYNGVDLSGGVVFTGQGGSGGEIYGDLAAGFYTFTVTRNTSGPGLGCTSDPLTVEVPDVTVLPTPSIPTIVNQTSCDAATPNGSLSADGDGGGTIIGYTFEWFQGSGVGGSQFVDGPNAFGIWDSSGGTPETISDLTTGNYTVRVTDDATGCQQIVTAFVDNVLTIPEVEFVTKSPNTICDYPTITADGNIEVQIDKDGLGTLVNFGLEGFDWDLIWYAGTTPSGVPIADPADVSGLTAGSPSLAALEPGFYTVVAQNLLTTCASQSLTIKVVDALVIPTITTAIVEQTSCDFAGNPNGEVQATVNTPTPGLFSVQWYTGGSATAGNELGFLNTNVADGISVTVTLRPSDSYTVWVYDEATGCAFQETVFVIQNIITPIVSLSSLPHTGCTYDGTITPTLDQGHAGVNYQFIWYEGQTIAGTIVQDITTTFGSGDDILEDADVVAYGGIPNLYSGYYTLQVIDIINNCSVDEVTVFLDEPAPLFDIQFNVNLRPANCAASSGVLTAYIDANSNNTIDAGEVNYASYQYTWYVGLPTDASASYYTNPEVAFLAAEFAVDPLTMIKVPPIVGTLGLGIDYFDSETPGDITETHGATIFNQESQTYTVVVEDLATGCKEFKSFFLPFVDAQTNTFVTKTDDTDCTIDNGTLEIIVKESDGTDANQSLYIVNLYNTQVPDLGVTVPIASLQRAGYTSDFSVDEDGWSAVSGTLTGNVGPIAAVNDVLEFLPTVANSTHYFGNDASVVGNSISISFDYYIPSANTNVDGFMVYETTGAVLIQDESIAATDSWTNVTIPAFVATQKGIEIHATTAGVQSFIGDAINDFIYITNVVVTDNTTPITFFSNVAPGDYSVVSRQDFGIGCFSELQTGVIEEAAQPPVLTPVLTHNSYCLPGLLLPGDGIVNVIAANTNDLADATGAPVNSGTSYTFEWFVGIGTGMPFVGGTDGTINVISATEEEISDLDADSYTVRITDDNTNCSIEQTYEIYDQPINPDITNTTATPSTNCSPIENGSLTILDAEVTSGQVEDYEFILYFNGTAPADQVATASVAGGEIPAVAPGVVFSNLSPGFYYITIERVTDGTGYGCISPPVQADEVLDNHVDPTFNFIYTPNVACNPASVIEYDGTLQADIVAGGGGYTFQWFLGASTAPADVFVDGTDGTLNAGGVAFANDQLVNIGEGLASVDNTYTVIVTDATGCSSTGSYVVVDDPLNPTVTVVPTAQASCNALVDGEINVTVVSDDAIVDYSYDLYDGSTNLFLSNNATGAFTGLLAGSYYVIATKVSGAAGGIGCITALATATIADNTVTPTLTLSQTANTACDFGTNPDGQITAVTSTGGFPATTYSYTITSPVLGAPINRLLATDNETFIDLEPGQYTVFVNDDDTDCTITGVITVEDNPEPIVFLATDVTVNHLEYCDAFGNPIPTDAQYANLLVTGTLPGTPADYSYTWYDGAANLGTNTPIGGVTGTALNVTNYPAINSGVYYVVATKTAGIDPGSSCSSAPIEIVIKDNHVTPTVVLSQTANTSCDPDFNSDATLTVTMSDASGPGMGANYNITWTSKPGTSGILDVLNVASPYTVPAIELITPGIYEAQVTNVATNCSFTTTITVEDNPEPIVFLATDVTVNHLEYCDAFGNPIPTDAQYANLLVTGTLPGTPADYSYTWYDGAANLGTNTPIGGVTGTALNVTNYPAINSGVYYVVATKTAGIDPGSSCSSAPIEIVIKDNHVTPTVVLSQTANTSCDPDFNSDATLTVTMSDASGPGMGANYNITWTSKPGTSGILDVLNVGSPYTVPAIELVTPGIYEAQVTNVATSCSFSATITVEDNPEPIVFLATDVTINNLEYCDAFGNPIPTDAQYASITVNSISPGVLGDYTFTWYDGAANLASSAAIPAVTGTVLQLSNYASIGAGTYYVVATKNLGVDPGSGCLSAPVEIVIKDNHVTPTVVLSQTANTSCDPDFNSDATLTVTMSDSGGPGMGANYDITWTSKPALSTVSDVLNVASPYVVPGGDLVTPGVYVAEVTNVMTSCSFSATITVEDNPEPIVILATDVTINNLEYCDAFGNPIPTDAQYASITVNSISPGVLGDYTYTWYDGAANLASSTAIPAVTGTVLQLSNYAAIGAGTYYVIATKNLGVDPGSGCLSAPVEIVIKDNHVTPTVVLSQTANTSCDPDFNSDATLTVTMSDSGGPGMGANYDITWTSKPALSTVSDVLNVASPYVVPGGDLVTPGVYVAEVTNVMTSCSFSATITVEDNPEPIVILATDVTINNLEYCDAFGNPIPTDAQYASITVNSISPGVLGDYTFTWYDGAANLASSAAIPAVTGTVLQLSNYASIGAGTYYVIATKNLGVDPGSGCLSAPVEMVIKDNHVTPTVVLSQTANTSCDPMANSDATLTVTMSDSGGPGMGANYDIAWTTLPLGSGVLDVLNVASPYVVPGVELVTPGVYVADVTNVMTSCSFSATITVGDIPEPIIIEALITNQSDCNPYNGAVTVLSVSPLGANPIDTEYTFEWYETTLGGGFGTAILRPEVTSSINGLDEGTYFVVAVKNFGFKPSEGCKSAPYRLDVFNVSEDPILSFVQPDPDVNCVVDPTQGSGSVLVTSNVNIVTWNWFERDLNDNGVFNEPGVDDAPITANELTTANTNEYMGLAPGVYRLMATDVNGCTAQTEVTILKRPTLSTPNVVAVDIILTTNCGGNGYFEVSNISIGDPFDPTNPDASITDSLRLATDFSYDWYFGSINNVDSIAYNHSSILDSVAGGTYYVIVTSLATSCESIPTEILMDDIDVNYPNLELIQTTPQLGCQFLSYTGELTATVTENDPTDTDDVYRFEWFFEGSPVLPAGATGPVTTGNISAISNLPIGRYDVTIYNDSTGCSATALYIIEDDSPEFIPVINTGTEPVTNCLLPNGGIFGKGVPFTNANGINTYPLLPYDYDIDIYTGNLTGTLDENSPSGDLASISGASAGVNLVAPNVAAGFYTVRIIDNKTGCYSVKSDQVFDRQTSPLVEVVEDNPLINCDPAKANGQLSATGDGRVSGFDFEWYVGTTASGTLIGNKNKLIGQSDGEFTVRVTNTASGCSTDATGTITDGMLDAPTPTPLLISDRFSCINPDGELIVSVGGTTSGYNFEWYDQGSAGGSNFSDDVHIRNLEIGTYSVIAIDKVTGCDSEPVDIDINDQRLNPEFTFETEGSKCDEDTGLARIITTNATQGDQVFWTDLATGLGLGLGSEIHNLGSGDYQADVTTFYGCEASGVVTIGTVLTNYNLVTSDGDGINDNFQIDCITNYPNNNIQIFNRAGVLVYKAKGYNNADISFKGLGENGYYPIGADLPNGTYYYVIDKGDGSKLIAGFLELIR